MIDGLKPYSAMKDSGVPWLGEVPEHWEVRRGKWLFRHRKQINVDRASTNVLSLTLRGVVNNDPDNPEGLVPRDYATYQRFNKGDLVFKLIDLENLRTSRVGLVHEDGIMSSAYVRLVPQSARNIRFFFQQYFDLYQRGIYNQLGAGVRSTLGPGDLLDLSVAVPPLPEQSAIARFLDQAERRIRRYIRAKQKLIKLLEEQKQAIIHRAVTRGLDPNVRLKPSGVEWLGDVPENWDVTRLKFVATHIVDCLHATPVYSETGEYPAIRTADVQPGRLLVESARRVDAAHYRRWTARMTPAEGDIFYTREGERFGIAALVPADVRACISQRMMAFRIHPTHSSAYIMWQINCQHVYAQAAGDVIGAAAPHVNVERIKNFWLVLPPRQDQDDIVAAVTRAHAVPDSAIARAKSEIALIREYRTRLIADVVTGKLDVREAAERLPDETVEPESIGDSEALADGDENGEGTEMDPDAEETEA